MSGAPVFSIEISERKAYTSALTFMATKDITPLAQPGERMHTITDVAGGRFVAFGGGGFSMREGSSLLDDYALSLTGVERPRYGARNAESTSAARVAAAK